MSDAYKSAGVNIEAGYAAVEKMKDHVKTTRRPEVMDELGGFGGGIDLSKMNLKAPVLVSGTDGVGTKLMLAFETGRHETIGIDAVAMCVNDIVTQGAEPLYFLDYIACGKLEPEKIAAIVSGIAAGCRDAGCALIGGETAEMPGMYKSDHYDLAGFTTGVVEKEERLTGEKIAAGDVLIGLASSGIHSNGYSLVRKIVADYNLKLDEAVPGSDKTLGEVLMTPTRIYVKPVLEAIKNCSIHGAAHITGGGLFENVPRMLPEGLGAVMNPEKWTTPEVFKFLQETADLKDRDMYSTFNMGLGFVLAVPADEKAAVFSHFEAAGIEAIEAGVVTDTGKFEIEGVGTL